MGLSAGSRLTVYLDIQSSLTLYFVDLWDAVFTDVRDFVMEAIVVPAPRLAESPVGSGTIIYTRNLFNTYYRTQSSLRTPVYSPLSCSIRLPGRHALPIAHQPLMPLWTNHSICPLRSKHVNSCRTERDKTTTTEMYTGLWDRKEERKTSRCIRDRR